MYLFATITSYLFTYLNVLPSADQKNYFIVIMQGNVKIIKSIIQLIVIILFKNYYCWLIIEILFSIAMYIYTNFKIKKMYTYYSNEKNISFKQLLKKYEEIVAKTKDLFFHKIGGLVVNQTDNIIISCFGNLTDVGIYTNYVTIFNLLTGSIEQAFYGITSSIGNLIVEDSKRVYSLWKEIHILTLFLSTIIGFLFYKLANPFISIWVGSEYTFSNIVVLAITLNIMFKIIKQPIDKFKEAYGIFEDRQAPFVEAIINLVVSIILVQKIGVLGVVIGTCVSNLIITAIWKPYITFKKGFNEKFINYIKLNIPYLIISIFAIVISNVLIRLTNINTVSNVGELLIMFVVYGIITLLVVTLIYLLEKNFRYILKKYCEIVKNMILNKIKRSKKIN
jgi:O-antigen/teichoic acid export membrane protein